MRTVYITLLLFVISTSCDPPIRKNTIVITDVSESFPKSCQNLHVGRVREILKSLDDYSTFEAYTTSAGDSDLPWLHVTLNKVNHIDQEKSNQVLKQESLDTLDPSFNNMLQQEGTLHTCIYTSIRRSISAFKRFKADTMYNELVIMSDMIEDCRRSIGGNHIDLEAIPIDSLLPMVDTLSLPDASAQIHKVYVIRCTDGSNQSNAYPGTENIEKFWNRIFTKMKIEKKVEYHINLPDDLTKPHT